MGIGNKENQGTSLLKNRWENRSEILPAFIEDFTTNFNEKDPILKEMEEFAKKDRVPILLPSAANVLYILTSLLRPKTILEIGTGIGYSTITMLKGAGKNREIISIDSNIKRLKIAKEFILKSGYNATLLHEDGFTTVRNLIADEKTFDFIFVDSGKSEYTFFNYKIQTLLSDKGVAVFDNVLFRGYVTKSDFPEKYKRSVNLLKHFLETVKEYPGFEASIIPIGDGLLILKRKT